MLVGAVHDVLIAGDLEVEPPAFGDPGLPEIRVAALGELLGVRVPGKVVVFCTLRVRQPTLRSGEKC